MVLPDERLSGSRHRLTCVMWQMAPVVQMATPWPRLYPGNLSINDPWH